MRPEIALCLLVDDYDDAIDFYCHKLGLFKVDANNDFGSGNRFVYLKFADPTFAFAVHLQKPAGAEMPQSIGQQAGRYILVSLPIEDADFMLARLNDQRIEAEDGIHELPYGRQIIIRDHAGNRMALFQRHTDDE